MDTHPPIYGASLCSGVGALDLSLGIVLDNYKCLLHVEREVSACEVLAARMEDGSIPEGFIWSDLSTCPAGEFRGIVSILSAGLPCTPYSVAGKQRGDKDDRYIWPAFFRIIREMRPAVVALENVPAFAAWFRPVGEELSGLGYEFEAGLFSAAEVGASHTRLRWFALCWAPGDERSAGILRQLADFAGRGCGELRQPPGSHGLADGGDKGLVADPGCGFLPLAGRPGGWGWTSRRGSGPRHARSRAAGNRGEEAGTGADGVGRRGLAGGIGALGDADLAGLEGRQFAGGGLSDQRIAGEAGDSELAECPVCGGRGWIADPWPESETGWGCSSCDRTGLAPQLADSALERRPGIGAFEPGDGYASGGEPDGRDTLPLFAPGPGARSEWERILRDFPWLAPAISEEEIESHLRVMAPWLADMVVHERTNALRAIGNGVTSLCAAAALVTLARRAGVSANLTARNEPDKPV